MICGKCGRVQKKIKYGIIIRKGYSEEQIDHVRVCEKCGCCVFKIDFKK